MWTLPRKVTRALAAVGISAAVATASALLWPPERTLPQIATVVKPVQKLEWQGYDLHFHWRGVSPADIDKRVVIVGYSYDTEGALEQGTRHPWPPPRRFHAGVIDNLVRDGARVVAFDILMNTPSAAGVADDRAFANSLSHAKDKVVLACRINRDDTAVRKSIVDPYHDDKLGIDFEQGATEAYADVIPDSDDVVRRLYPLQRFQGEWLPSLSAAAFLKLTDRKAEDSRVTPSTMFVGGAAIPRTGETVADPADPENTMGTSYMDFPAGLSTFPIYRYEDVYNNKFPPGTFRGKAVFVGVTGVELTAAQQDRFRTAFSAYTPEAVGGQVTRDVYGVVVQGQMCNALLRDLIFRQATPWQIWVLVFAFSSLGTWAVRSSLTVRGPVLLVVSIVGYVGLSFALFVFLRVYLPYVIPGLLMTGSAAAVAWFERGQMRKLWSGYVSPAYMEVMLREGFEAKPQRYHATVIFGDIRNFTGFSENHTPEVVVQLLDKHLEKLVRIVFEEGGTVDKFLGDGVMIVFGAPAARPEPDATFRAVRAAWRMREAALIPITDDEGNIYTFRTGFGVTTGPFVAGHVGSKKLSSFTLIGDTVNLSARLQAVTGEPDVVIDQATYEQVVDHVTVEDLGLQKVKGKDQAIACYKVTAWHE